MRRILSQGGFSVFTTLLIALSAVATVVIYFAWYRSEDGLFERVPPVIKLQDNENFRGMGVEPYMLKLSLSDLGSGLDEVVIRLNQHRERIDLGKKKFFGERHGDFSLEIGGPDYFGEEGDGKIEIKLWDKSFWSNSTDLILPIKIDSTFPRVSILTSQHNGQQGGAQLAFYRASDLNLKQSGVVVGTEYFYGVKGSLLDPGIKNDDIYGVIYGLGAAQSAAVDQVRLFAKDELSNEKQVKFYNKVAKRRFREAREVVSSQFMLSKLPNLIVPYQNEIESLDKNSDATQLASLLSEIRAAEDLKIRSVIKNRGLTKLLIDSEMIPPVGSPYYRYGERISYVFNEEVLAEVTSSGFRMAASANSEVLAAATGEVIFVENLSVFGKVVILDHGLGITTTYAGLDSISVSPGDLVDSSKIIGTTGSSGIFFRPGVFFEVRVQGAPVTPLEWWEPGWVKSHILDKIKEIKRLLGVGEINPIE